MKMYSWTPYWPIKFKSTCSLFLLFQQNSIFCNQLNINPMGSTMVSKWNLSKNWIVFLVFLWKKYFFLNLIFFRQLFFCIKYHVFTLLKFNAFIILSTHQNWYPSSTINNINMYTYPRPIVYGCNLITRQGNQLGKLYSFKNGTLSLGVCEFCKYPICKICLAHGYIVWDT
jgi:hypothetical protein